MTRHLRTNGICDRSTRPCSISSMRGVPEEDLIYRTLEELQISVGGWIENYNEQWPHQGRWCYGKGPM